jgi:transcriptional regulator with XRE-family HTH domain
VKPETEQEMKAWGLALVVLRRARGLSCQEVAVAAKVTPSNLSRYENGRGIPRFGTLRHILAALDVSSDSFFRSVSHVKLAIAGDDLEADEAEDEDDTLRSEESPEETRARALRLAQEVGKAFAHLTLTFLDLWASGLLGGPYAASGRTCVRRWRSTSPITTSAGCTGASV